MLNNLTHNRKLADLIHALVEAQDAIKIVAEN